MAHNVLRADPNPTDAQPPPVSLSRSAPVRLGPLLVEPAIRRLSHDDGREAVLEPRVMQVLVALTQAEGAILSRDHLLAACWPGMLVGEDALNRVMVRIRRLCAGVGEGVLKLETITKVGYRLVRLGDGDARTPRPPGHRPERASICVAPFANLSDDVQQDYFSDGITEDIITDLGRVSSLFVTARATAFALKGKAIDLPTLHRDLGVSHVLTGSVRKAGGRVRISAQLADAASGGQVWAERYDRDFSDIFTLQDEISESIVQALKLTLLPEERRAIEKRGATNPAAYNLYLMARQYYAIGRDGELAGLGPILRLCERAIELDPGYARAWALKGFAEMALHTIHGRAGDGGRAAVARALALDPGLAEAHALSARHLWQSGHADEARRAAELALALDPESWEAQAEAGRLAYVEHRFADAVPCFQRAAAIDARAVGDAAMLMSSHRALNDAEGVARAARLTLARAERALAADPNNSPAMGFGVSALAALGEHERAREWMERALLVDPDNMNMRYNFAGTVSWHFRDVDAALALLAPLFAQISQTWLTYAERDPELALVRADPRFGEMANRARARLEPAP